MYSYAHALPDVEQVMAQTHCSEEDAIEAILVTATLEEAVKRAASLVTYYKQWGA